MRKTIAALALALSVVLPAIATPHKPPVPLAHNLQPPGITAALDIHFCPRGMLIISKETSTFFTWEELAVYRRMTEQMEAKEKGTSL